ncbi:MAG: 50S ribosomal protein L11 methyltransferase [Hyphomicrobiales bacterium]
MSEARFTLTVPGLTHDRATALATELESDLLLDPLAVVINETDESRGLWELVLFFADDTQAQDARHRPALTVGRIVALPDRDWVRDSLAGLSPVAAGRFFLYGSHDRHRRRPGGVSLEIDAGTAFGTGHHGTTEGCLAALDLILKRGRPRRILDVGCGTGVLAIAAARATRHAALASDIDPEAVRVTRANAALNGVRPLVRSVVAPGLKHPLIARQAPYDLIFANILARPLVALAHGLAESLAPGGRLILSGLTRDQGRWIIATYRNHGLVLATVVSRGNWLALVLARPARKKRPGGRSPGRFWAGTRGAGWEED